MACFESDALYKNIADPLHGIRYEYAQCAARISQSLSFMTTTAGNILVKHEASGV